jgi:hypothetical protein
MDVFGCGNFKKKKMTANAMPPTVFALVSGEWNQKR